MLLTVPNNDQNLNYCTKSGADRRVENTSVLDVCTSQICQRKASPIASWEGQPNYSHIIFNSGREKRILNEIAPFDWLRYNSVSLLFRYLWFPNSLRSLIQSVGIIDV